MGDDECFTCRTDFLSRTQDGSGHAFGDVDIGFPPAGSDRVDEEFPVVRIAQRMVTGAEALPLEGVGRLGDVIVQVDLQRPRAVRWKSGILPYRTPVGLSTSP